MESELKNPQAVVMHVISLKRLLEFISLIFLPFTSLWQPYEECIVQKRQYSEHSVVRGSGKKYVLNIKNVSRDNMLAAHWVPPQMMGNILNNTSGFGDVEKASRMFVRDELMPLQKHFEELNDWLGKKVIRFEPYTLELAEENPSE